MIVLNIWALLGCLAVSFAVGFVFGKRKQKN